MRDPGHQSDPSRNALFGPGSVVEGKLSFTGQVHIDGKFTGEITTTDALVVGEHATVDANIRCGTVVVAGQVKGNIRATESVEVQKAGRVIGDIATPSLSVAQGAVFDGVSHMNGSVDLPSFEPRNGGNGKKHKARSFEPRQK